MSDMSDRKIREYWEREAVKRQVSEIVGRICPELKDKIENWGQPGWIILDKEDIRQLDTEKDYLDTIKEEEVELNVKRSLLC